MAGVLAPGYLRVAHFRWTCQVPQRGRLEAGGTGDRQTWAGRIGSAVPAGTRGQAPIRATRCVDMTSPIEINLLG